MNVTGESWRRLWGELGAHTIDGGLFNQLVAAYSQQHRHYHTLQHLRECLANLDAAASLAQHAAEVELALWFHDAVHDPRRDDNEEQSAAWARRSVLAAGCAEEVAARVESLVLATKTHDAAQADADTRLLVDIDLAILGAAPARFAQYEQQVRAEYAHVPQDAYVAGRTAVLARFLGRDRIFVTDAFHAALEQRARDNIANSLTRMQA